MGSFLFSIFQSVSASTHCSARNFPDLTSNSFLCAFGMFSSVFEYFLTSWHRNVFKNHLTFFVSSHRINLILDIGRYWYVLSVDVSMYWSSMTLGERSKQGKMGYASLFGKGCCHRGICLFYWTELWCFDTSRRD